MLDIFSIIARLHQYVNKKKSRCCECTYLWTYILDADFITMKLCNDECKKEFLDENLYGNENFNILQEKVKNFYKTEKSPQKINIFLLINSNEQKLSGGANLGKNITLECSRTTPISYGRFADVIWHEIAHTFQQEYFNNLIAKNDKDIKKPKTWPNKSFNTGSILREPATYCLFDTFGYLTNKYINNRKKDFPTIAQKKFDKENLKNFSSWPIFVAYKLFDITEEYIKNNSAIDQNFFENIIKTWEKYLELIED